MVDVTKTKPIISFYESLDVTYFNNAAIHLFLLGIELFQFGPFRVFYAASWFEVETSKNALD